MTQPAANPLSPPPLPPSRPPSRPQTVFTAATGQQVRTGATTQSQTNAALPGGQSSGAGATVGTAGAQGDVAASTTNLGSFSTPLVVRGGRGGVGRVGLPGPPGPLGALRAVVRTAMPLQPLPVTPCHLLPPLTAAGGRWRLHGRARHRRQRRCHRRAAGLRRPGPAQRLQVRQAGAASGCSPC